MNNTPSMNEATNGSPLDTAFYKIDKNSVLWNLIGSLVAAASSFVLLLFVTRILGIADGGTFPLHFPQPKFCSLLANLEYGPFRPLT